MEMFGLESADQLEWLIGVKTDPATIRTIPAKMDPEKLTELQAKRVERAKKLRATIARRG